LVEAKKICSVNMLGMHLHDTKGMAEKNTLEAINLGVRIFDSSVGGLGGCPFAKGAKGNISTESMLDIAGRLGFSTGIDLEKLKEAMKILL
jgi:hydroxymethylglutaryl-CoA lyase